MFEPRLENLDWFQVSSESSGEQQLAWNEARVAMATGSRSCHRGARTFHASGGVAWCRIEA